MRTYRTSYITRVMPRMGSLLKDYRGKRPQISYNENRPLIEGACWGLGVLLSPDTLWDASSHSIVHISIQTEQKPPILPMRGPGIWPITLFSSQSQTNLFSGMKRLVVDMLIESELVSYRTEVLFLFVYRFLI